MEKNKKRVKFAGFAMVFLLSLFVCVGCNGDAELNDVCTVGFSLKEEKSRLLRAKYENYCNPEDAYWTFTAARTIGSDGTYSTGASPVDAYGEPVEEPMNSNAGFTSNFTRVFSKGSWDFKVYGYMDAGHMELIYTGAKTVDVQSNVSVTFEVSSVYEGTKGRLAMDAVTIRMPDALALDAYSVATAKLYDGENLVASSSLTLTDPKDANGSLTFATFSFEDGKDEFTQGIHTLTCRIYVKAPHDSGAHTARYADFGLVENIPVCFYIRSGATTRLSGSLNDRSLKPVGGRIIYKFDETTETADGSPFKWGVSYGRYFKNLTYTFYDSNGNVLPTQTVSGLATAVAYERLGTPLIGSISNGSGVVIGGNYMEGNFLVYDNTNGLIDSIGWGGYGIDAGSSTIGWGKTEGYTGKKWRDAVFPPNDTGVRDVAPALSPLLVNLDQNSVPFAGRENNTIWAYLDYVNCYGNLSTYPAFAKYNDTSAVVQAPGGCTDWFIPSPRELALLGLWSTGLVYKYLSATSPKFWAGWNTTAPTDAEKLKVYNWFDNRGIYTSGQARTNTAEPYDYSLAASVWRHNHNITGVGTHHFATTREEGGIWKWGEDLMGVVLMRAI